MLTSKQRELLLLIDAKLNEDGVPPSFEEMKEALGLKSKSGVHRLITALEERGFIRRLPHRARALEILRQPQDREMVDIVPSLATSELKAADESRTKFSPTVIRGDFKSGLAGAVATAANNSVELPLYGRIAAGTPIEALREGAETIGVPGAMLSGSGEHYALEVAGDSMVDAGILDGDTVLIRRGDTAENGTIVVALIDENEVTLKRLRRKGASIALEPANRAYETRIFGPDRVKVQGRLVGLLRRY